MAGSCPKCGAIVDHDFGIVGCTKCGTILSIDFDGNISLSEPGDFSIESNEPLELVEQESETGLSVEAAPIFESPPEPPEFAEPQVEHVPPLSPVDEDLLPPIPQDSLQEAKQEVADGPVDFSDVVDYANASELDDSPLVYTLTIEGIDHGDIRKRIVEVLSDIRLNIHVKDLLPQIKDGILELHDLSPIKAHIIASRLREETVVYHWRQGVFQSEESQPDT